MSEKSDPAVKGTLTLKIGSVSTYMTKIGQTVESLRQQVAGIEWYIRANTEVVDNVTYLGCRLVGENAFKWSALVDATFRIVKKYRRGFGNEQSFDDKLMGKEALHYDWGFPKFVAKEDLLSDANSYIAGDSIEICVDFVLKDVSFSIFDEGQAPVADIKLKVEGNAFFVNKGYLSVVSSAFRDMFALTEATEGKKEMEEIELKDIDASEFKEFLGVVYPTRCPITDANVISVFRIADRYDVQHVVTDCETHLAGVNSVPWFDKLKVTVDLRRDHLRNHLIETMTCKDIKAIKLAENRDQLGEDVLRAVFERHVGIYHNIYQ